MNQNTARQAFNIRTAEGQAENLAKEMLDLARQEKDASLTVDKTIKFLDVVFIHCSAAFAKTIQSRCARKIRRFDTAGDSKNRKGLTA